MTQFILIVWVTILGTTNPLVYTVSGSFPYEQCRDLIPVKVAESKQRYQMATIKAECLQMVPR